MITTNLGSSRGYKPRSVAYFAHQTVFLLEFPLLVGYGFAKLAP